MNDKIGKCINDIAILLKKEPIFCDFLKADNDIKKNKMLHNKINEMNFYKKCASTIENTKSINDFNEIKTSLSYKNYILKKTEAYDLLNQIKEIILK